MFLRAAARFRPSLAIAALAALLVAAFVGFGSQHGGGRNRPLIGAELISATNFGLTGSVANLTPGVNTTLNLNVTNPYTVPIDLTSVTVAVSPTVTATFPTNGSFYKTSDWNAGCSTAGICGTASAPNGVSVTSTVVAVENTTTSTWWGGSSFNQASAEYLATGGTPTSWALALAATNLTNGDSYSVTGKATDSTGNVGTNSTDSFTYTTSPPSPLPPVPANCTGTFLSLNSVPFTGGTPSATYTYPTASEPVIPANGSATVPVTLLLDRNAPNTCQNVTFPFNYAATATYGLTGSCINKTTNGGYTVQKGQAICITGRVNGGVTVNSGGALYLNGATINGAVTSTGAVSLEICGSSVSGKVSASGTTGFLMIGDNGDDSAEGAACSNNTLSAVVTLTGNQAGFELGGNSIGGDVTITNNSGNGPTAEDNLPEVEGNSITGSLACSGNNPAPSFGNKTNTATVSKTGQCVGL